MPPGENCLLFYHQEEFCKGRTLFARDGLHLSANVAVCISRVIENNIYLLSPSSPCPYLSPPPLLYPPCVHLASLFHLPTSLLSSFPFSSSSLLLLLFLIIVTFILTIFMMLSSSSKSVPTILNLFRNHWMLLCIIFMDMQVCNFIFSLCCFCEHQGGLCYNTVSSLGSTNIN